MMIRACAAADKRTSARPVGSLGAIYTIMLVRAEEFDYKLRVWFGTYSSWKLRKSSWSRCAWTAPKRMTTIQRSWAVGWRGPSSCAGWTMQPRTLL